MSQQEAHQTQDHRVISIEPRIKSHAQSGRVRQEEQPPSIKERIMGLYTPDWEDVATRTNMLTASYRHENGLSADEEIDKATLDGLKSKAVRSLRFLQFMSHLPGQASVQDSLLMQRYTDAMKRTDELYAIADELEQRMAAIRSGDGTTYQTPQQQWQSRVEGLDQADPFNRDLLRNIELASRKPATGDFQRRSIDEIFDAREDIERQGFQLRANVELLESTIDGYKTQIADLQDSLEGAEVEDALATSQEIAQLSRQLRSAESALRRSQTAYRAARDAHGVLQSQESAKSTSYDLLEVQHMHVYSQINHFIQVSAGLEIQLVGSMVADDSLDIARVLADNQTALYEATGLHNAVDSRASSRSQALFDQPADVDISLTNLGVESLQAAYQTQLAALSERCEDNKCPF